MRISWTEYLKIKDLKTLDLEFCDFGHLNILNLGWTPWGKWFCLSCEKEHVLCKELCLPFSRNVFRCELVRKRVKGGGPVKPNRTYDLARCYLCSRELAGASKKSVIKNRNDPQFWGIKSGWKILCLKCLGKKFYRKMVGWQQKKFREYVRRGYV